MHKKDAKFEYFSFLKSNTVCTTAKTSYNAITSPHGATMESFPFSMKFNCTLERPVDAVRNLLFEGEGKKKGMLTSSTCVYHFFPPSSPLSLCPWSAPPMCSTFRRRRGFTTAYINVSQGDKGKSVAAKALH